MSKALVALSLLLVALGACGPSSEGPVERCKKVAQQCKLKDGLIGVCVRAEAKAAAQCAREPCPVELPGESDPFVCTPQH